MHQVSPALFLDRDGIINVDFGYGVHPEQTVFVKGIFKLCGQALAAGYRLVVVTNQAGIARGYYSEDDFHTYMDWMQQEFVDRGVPLAGVYFCPHHPEGKVARYRKVCECRKPAPGMILCAAVELNLDLAASVLVGDKASDVAAGKAAGVGCCLQVEPVQSTRDPQHVAFKPDAFALVREALLVSPIRAGSGGFPPVRE